MTRAIVLMALLALPGCDGVRRALEGGPNPTPAASGPVVIPETQEEVQAVVASAGRSEAAPRNARTVEQFDTTTEAERQIAVAAAEPAEDAEAALGSTIATLGDPSDPGLWLATPLVSEARPGRLALGDQSVLVELRPIPGAETAGSRISLPAIRLLGAPLTGLTEIEVFGR